MARTGFQLLGSHFSFPCSSLRECLISDISLSSAFLYALGNAKLVKLMKEGKGKPVTSSVNVRSWEEARDAADFISHPQLSNIHIYSIIRNPFCRGPGITAGIVTA